MKANHSGSDMKRIRSKDRRITGRAGRHLTLPSAPVDARQLQNALLLICALFASLALVNLGSELAVLSRHWQGMVEFIANGLFVP